MIRSFFSVLLLTIYLILSLPIMLIFKIIELVNPVFAETAMYRIIQTMTRIISWVAGCRPTVIGLENIPKDEAVLFIGNHQSYFDIVLGLCLIPPRCAYVAKKELLRFPLLNLNMLFIHCLFLDRDNLKKGLETIKTAIQSIKDGRSMFIYPEGTRNKGPELPLMEFHRGSFKIAQRTGCRIIPVAFTNTAEILERHFPIMKKTNVVVEFGKPVAYGDLTRDQQKQIDTYYRDVLTEMVEKNRNFLP